MALKLIEPLIERAPKIAERVADKRPFAKIECLISAIRDELFVLDDENKIALFNAHPELSPEKPLEMTNESQNEQGRLNLTATDFNNDIMQLKKLNAEYRQKFGFPFITAVAKHENLASILKEINTRLAGDMRSEIDNAIAQVAYISATRATAQISDIDLPSDAPKMKGVK